MEHSAANSCKNRTQIGWSITYMDKEIFEKNSLYFGVSLFLVNLAVKQVLSQLAYMEQASFG
jgi:hypothetical protein